jgi:zinc protease
MAPALFGGIGDPGDPVPFLSKARTGTLPSGLRYYLLENSKPQGRVYLGLAVDAGSLLEEDNERGLAHFVEHIAFDSTVRFPESALIDYLQTLGMRLGPDFNAHTNYDSTVYGIETPVEGEDRHIPEKGLWVIDDWSQGVTFPQKEVDQERPVIIEELRSRRDAQYRMSRQLLGMIFEGSPYTDREPGGLLEVIETAPPERLEGFYHKWYRADNMAVIIVGDFDAAALETRLGEYFTIPKPPVPTDRPRFPLPEPVPGRFDAQAFTDKELSFSQAFLYFKRPSQAPSPIADLAAWRTDLIESLIDLMVARRFEEATHDPATPYTGAWAGCTVYGWGGRYYVMTAQAKAGALEPTVRELFTLQESLLRYGFTQGELDQAIAALLSNEVQMVSEQDRLESRWFAGRFTDHFLYYDMLPDMEWELAALRKVLPLVSIEEINGAVKDFFAGEDLRVFLAGPNPEEILSSDQLQARREEVKGSEVQPPQDREIPPAFLEAPPEAGTILSETGDPETAARILRLGNGGQVILKTTPFQNNEVRFYALARGGTRSGPPEGDVSRDLAAEMYNVSGLGPFGPTELSRFLADKQVSLGLWTTDYLRGLEGSSSVEDLPLLFEMIYLYFTQPRFDPGSVQALLDEYRTTLILEQEDPNAAFVREIRRTIYGNPRFHSRELADLDRVDPAAALDFIRQGLNPGDWTFVFLGNLDNRVPDLIETYLASIPPGPSFNEWALVDPQRPGAVEREVRKGRDDRSEVYLAWFSPLDYSEEASAAAQVLSEYLDIRLTEEIRERLGGTYSPGVSVSLNIIPRGELAAVVYLVCAPRRVEELCTAVEEELAAVARGQVEGGTLSKAILALVKAQESEVQKNSYLAQSFANSAVIYHSPLDRVYRRPGYYEAVKGEDISSLMKSLTARGPARVVLYPED